MKHRKKDEPLTWYMEAVSLSPKCWKKKEEVPDTELELWKPLIVAILLEMPCYGYRKVTKELARQGHVINHKKIMRIMEVTGLKQKKRRFKPRTTDSRHKMRIYPNLVAGLTASYPNHIWVSDITYVKLDSGFCYVAIVLDVYTKKVVGWSIDMHMEESLVLEALRMALETGTPMFHHSDRGGQYCGNEYTELLEKNGVQISMAATGVSVDNPFAESFNRTLKVEEVYLYRYQNLAEAKQSITTFIKNYHEKRIHQSLDYVTPNEFCAGWVLLNSAQGVSLAH
jgi:putative transposase